MGSPFLLPVFHGSLAFSTQIKTLLFERLSHELLHLHYQQIPGFISWDCYVLFSAEQTGIVWLKGLQVLKRWCFEEDIQNLLILSNFIFQFHYT